eukprot:gnl/Chilomastix_cuspidata/2182.p2 GENE.gnl/Chilomastix_cuspidata/2182~~gnl/Chilomastix_cuspidata/2182.p2  ORF type:complete len:335 (+),score=178.90 gnl/Chilomastix_cuspidata/2182:228-1232(+)
MSDPAYLQHLRSFSNPAARPPRRGPDLSSQMKLGSLKKTRERLETPDGDFLDLDWYLPPGTTPAFDGLVVVAHHGIGSSGSALYILKLAAFCTASGVALAAMNARGSSGEPNRRPGLYTAGKTDDLAQVANHCAERFAAAKVFLLGYSLGGSIVANTVCREEGLRANILGAISVSAPLDLALCTERLEQTPNYASMNQFILNGLKHVCREKQKAHPSPMLERAIRAKTVREFDQVYFAASRGYSSAEEYYARESPFQVLQDARIPLFLLHAEDDPVADIEGGLGVLEREGVRNPLIETFQTPAGGHCTFTCPHNPLWLEEFIQLWCSHVAARAE